MHMYACIFSKYVEIKKRLCMGACAAGHVGAAGKKVLGTMQKLPFNAPQTNILLVKLKIRIPPVLPV